jgi:carbonic anhydrase
MSEEAMDVIDTVTERNTRFAQTAFTADMPLLPRLKTMVIGCVDPRVDPAHVLGIELGEAAIIRNIGGRVTPDVIGQLVLLGRLATIMGGEPDGLGDLVVLQHTDCGITRLDNPPEPLAGFFGVDTAGLAGKHVHDPWAAAEADVAVLRSLPPLVARFRVTGLVYDVATGRVARAA